MAKLSATFVSKTKQTGWHSDSLNKLYLFVSKDGNTKSWKFKGRVKGKEIKKTIGHYPAMTLADARDLASQINTQFKNGIDYFAEQEKAKYQADKDALTVGELINDWFSIKQAKGLKKNAIETDQKRLRKHILPSLENIPVKDITKSMLRDICDKPALEHAYTANRVASMLQNIFEHAVMTEVIENSPAQYLTKFYPKPKTKKNPHLKIEEIPEFLNDLKAGLKFQLLDIVTYHMILTQLHLMLRPSEAAMMKWEYIDFDACCVSIPVMEGVKLKSTHIQPLSPQVIALLEAQRPYSQGSEYVFPSDKGDTPHRNTETANNALKKRLGYKDRLTAHGMRRTAGNALPKIGKYDRELIDLALAHDVGGVTSRTYNEDTRYDERQKMLARWSEYLSSISD